MIGLLTNHWINKRYLLAVFEPGGLWEELEEDVFDGAECVYCGDWSGGLWDRVVC